MSASVAAAPRASVASSTPVARSVRFRTLLAAIVVVVFFIPIKRYTLPASLPVNLEPYRLMIALVACAWFTALMVDRRLRLRATGVGAPLVALLLACVVSIAVNAATLQGSGLTSLSIKALTFLLSFCILFIFAVNVLRTREDIDYLIRIIVFCGAVIALEVLIEYRTGHNLFNDVGQLLPFLHKVPLTSLGLDPTELAREGSLRAYGSAEDPIECSAFLVMLVPLALYLYQTDRRRRWLVASILLVAGVFATLSRTGVLMLATVAVVYVLYRPRSAMRAMPAVLPLLVAVFFAAPHTLGSIYSEFFPKGGIVAQQSQAGSPNQQVGQGDNRLDRVGPDLKLWTKRPFFGEGFGSRDPNPNDAAANHVKLSGQTDDQWLDSLLETGLLGVLALIWLFFRTSRRLKRVIRADTGADGWLALALLAAVDAFMIGMFTFDALGFVEVTIALFLVLALAASLVNVRADPDAVARP